MGQPRSTKESKFLAVRLMSTGTTSRIRARWARFARCIMVFLAASCRKDAAAPQPRFLAAYLIVSGNEQSGVVGQALPAPLVAKAVDSAGNPLPRQVVNFRVAAGGGSVFAGAALTNDQGVAQDLWTLGTATADSQRVEVRAVDATTGQPHVYAVFTAVAHAGAPATVAKLSSDSLMAEKNAASAETIMVVVRDRYGNLVPGVDGTWTPGSGSVTPTATDSAGVATAIWTAGANAGITTLQVSFGSAPSVQFRTEVLPTQVTFMSVSAGNGITCAVSVGGAAYCWGFYVVPGPEDTTLSLAECLDGFGNSERGACAIRATRVSTSLSFSSISAGHRHICGLAGTEAWCWGWNVSGELGTGDSAPPPGAGPQRVAGGNAFSSISAGAYYTCAISTTNSPFCWGSNTSGQLGWPGSAVSKPTGAGNVNNMMFIAASRNISQGLAHTCGILLDGTAGCWGQNEDGQLGDSTWLVCSQDFLRFGGSPCPDSRDRVAGNLTFKAVVVGQDGTCGTTTGGLLYCWGRDVSTGLRADEACYNGEPCATYPRLIDGPPALTMLSGQAGTACGLTLDGHAYCWGFPADGYSPPQQGRIVSPGLRFSTISVGWDHACGVATTGRIYCWGGNDFGQLGDNTFTARAAPTLLLNR